MYAVRDVRPGPSLVDEDPPRAASPSDNSLPSLAMTDLAVNGLALRPVFRRARTSSWDQREVRPSVSKDAHGGYIDQGAADVDVPTARRRFAPRPLLHARSSSDDACLASGLSRPSISPLTVPTGGFPRPSLGVYNLKSLRRPTLSSRSHSTFQTVDGVGIEKGRAGADLRPGRDDLLDPVTSSSSEDEPAAAAVLSTVARPSLASRRTRSTSTVLSAARTQRPVGGGDGPGAVVPPVIRQAEASNRSSEGAAHASSSVPSGERPTSSLRRGATYHHGRRLHAVASSSTATLTASSAPSPLTPPPLRRRRRSRSAVPQSRTPPSAWSAGDQARSSDTLPARTAASRRSETAVTVERGESRAERVDDTPAVPTKPSEGLGIALLPASPELTPDRVDALEDAHFPPLRNRNLLPDLDLDLGLKADVCAVPPSSPLHGITFGHRRDVVSESAVIDAVHPAAWSDWWPRGDGTRVVPRERFSPDSNRPFTAISLSTERTSEAFIVRLQGLSVCSCPYATSCYVARGGKVVIHTEVDDGDGGAAELHTSIPFPPDADLSTAAGKLESSSGSFRLVVERVSQEVVERV